MQPVSDESSRLRDYTRAKHEVAELVRATQALLRERGETDAVASCQDLLVRLAEDRFNLAVVGQFKRGKSSLMNAVIGRELLPTGLLPLTSAITALCYGAEDRVLLRRAGWTREQEVPLEALAEYITERGNPGNERGVLEARVEVPVPFLRRGLYFVDTPGIGSARHENTATTYQFLPQAAAVLFVTSVEAPLSAEEETFLQDIREQIRAVFVVVNKIDLLGTDESDDVMGYMRTHTEEILGSQAFQLYPLSARQALVAKQRQDGDGLRASGLPALEDALSTFLAEGQGRTLLISMLDHILDLLASAPLPAGVMQLEDKNSDAPHTISQETLDQLRERAVAVRNALLAGSPLAALQGQRREGGAGAAQMLEAAVAVSHTRRPGERGGSRPVSQICSICAAQLDVVFAFFAQWQNMLARSETAQHALIQVHGFCPVHTWQFQQMASPQGLSAGYAPLVEATRDALRDALRRLLDGSAMAPTDWEGAIAALLPSNTTCPACRVLRQTEREQIPLWLAALAPLDERTHAQQAASVCLPHLRAMLATAPDAAVAEALVRAQIQELDEIAEDLRGYTLKRAALRHGLTDTREEQAWRRALIHLAGGRNAQVS